MKSSPETDYRDLNHWKMGVPQNPDGLAYKIYHYHLNNPPCTMAEICKGVGISTKRSHKVTRIVNQFRKYNSWKWPNRADREQADRNQEAKIAGRHGEG